MKNTKETLNLIVLIGFLVSNFLTPLSYAVDDLEQISSTSSQNDEIVISNDSEKSNEQKDSETPMDSSASASEGQSLSEVDSLLAEGTSVTPQNDENGQESKNNDVLLGGKEVAEDENPQTEDFYKEDDRNLQSSTSLNPASLDKEVQDDSLTKEINNNEDAEDLPELTPVERGPMLKSAGDAQLNWTEGEDFFTISIARPDGVIDDGPAGFTIMDRNLGATTNEVNTTYGSYENGTGSYGYHYQWGNNYGFAQGCTIISSPLGSCNDTVIANPTGLEWDDSYNNSGYYSTDFINGDSLDYDVWSDSSHHDGVWGGAGDDESNNWGANEDNPTDRQGPCPSGYHVPSAGEWGLLIKYWAYASGYDNLVDGSEGLYYIDNEIARTDFMDYFKLPFAGFRNYYNASLNLQGSYGVYWSSSPYRSDSPDSARFLLLNSSYVYANNNNYRAFGISVRCFKDSYVAPQKSCASGATYYEELGECATRDADNIVFYWTGSDGKGLISIISGDIILTMLDKNQGATSNDISSTGSYGYHYQWGNNYGFEQGCNGNGSICIDDIKSASVNAQTGYENFWPGHPYSGSIFLKAGNRDYWLDNKDYDNLWGGSGDTFNTASVDTFWGGINNGDTRQGPCDTGYHVPSIGEWNALITYWYNAKNLGSKKSLTSLNNFSNSTFRTDFKLPLAGLRKNDNASISNQGSYGIYWSSSPCSAENPNSARRFYLSSSDVHADYDIYRTYGYSIRCFKDSPNASQTLILTFDVNGGELSGADSDGKLIQKVESGKLAQNPVKFARDGYDFEGWYTSTGYETVFDFSIPLTEDITVYAKWNEVYTITYNLDGGIESLPNPTTYTVESGTFGLYQPTKSGYMFLGWTGSDGDEPNANIYITEGSTGNRTYNAVWGTFEDIDAYSISSTGAVSYVTLMDRNMGAENDDITSTGSYGFHYQWGNNNGFQIGCWEFGCSDSVTANATETKAVWNSSYNNKGYNGIRFIMGSDDYWTGNAHYNGLRGGSDDNLSNNWGVNTITSSNITNRQGPCSEGYHVPSQGELNILFEYRCKTNPVMCEWSNVEEDNGLYYNDDPGVGLKFSEGFNIPYAGSRGDSGVLTYRYGHMWSSSPDISNNSLKWPIVIKDDYLDLFDPNYAIGGKSVRCFKNDYLFTQSSMIIHPNGGTGAMILVEADKIKTLGTPHRANSIFSGWYDTDIQGNKIETGNDAPANLYARWICEEGYIEVNDECVQVFTVTFDADTNGGTTTTGEELIASGTVLDLSNYTATKTGRIFTGWNTDSGATEPISNLTVTGATTLYAIFSKTLIVTYSTGTGVSEISKNSDKCTLYNRDNSCTVVVPDITLSEGYATGVLSNGVDTLNPGEDITLAEDDTYTATASAIRYSIAYNLDGGTLVGGNPEEYTIESGFALINPTKDDYVFAGWIGTNLSIPTITVIISVGTTGNLSYTANWEEDFNHNGEADSTEVKKVVEFLPGDHGTLGGTTRYEILSGLALSSTGYVEPTKNANSGYVFSGWDKVIDTTSSIIADTTYTAIWGEDFNGNGENDAEETKYKVTVNYVYSRGGEASPSVSGMYLSGIVFNYVSPNVQYYTANSGTVSGTGIEQDQNFTVIYTPITDKNNNGIADEIDGYKPGGSGGGGGGGGGGGSSGGKTQTGNNAGGTGNQINSNTGDTVSSGANNQQPNNTTGSNVQTGNQTPQNNVSSGANAKDPVTSMDSSVNTSEGQQYSQEFQQAYEFAEENGITIMPTIQKAQMNSPLTRIAMAKMLSQYAINILGKKPKNTVVPKFNDVTEKMDSDYDDGVTLAYQLGIMGQNMQGNKFRPEDEVTRAEFATALSRLLYNTSDGKYKSTSEYYINHMKKLKEEGIITKDDPVMKEKRGYVMIMLMRSAK